MNLEDIKELLLQYYANGDLAGAIDFWMHAAQEIVTTTETYEENPELLSKLKSLDAAIESDPTFYDAIEIVASL